MRPWIRLKEYDLYCLFTVVSLANLYSNAVYLAPSLQEYTSQVDHLRGSDGNCRSEGKTFMARYSQPMYIHSSLIYFILMCRLVNPCKMLHHLHWPCKLKKRMNLLCRISQDPFCIFTCIAQLPLTIYFCKLEACENLILMK